LAYYQKHDLMKKILKFTFIIYARNSIHTTRLFKICHINFFKQQIHKSQRWLKLQLVVLARIKNIIEAKTIISNLSH